MMERHIFQRARFNVLYNIEKLKINKKMQPELQARTLYAIRGQSEDSPLLLVTPNANNSSQGSIVTQVESTEEHIVFQVKGKIKIKEQDIAQTITIHCLVRNGNFLIPHHEYHRLISEINKENEEQQREQSYSSSSLDQEEHDRNSEDDSVYAKQPTNKIQSYQHDSENGKMNKKGRGRPKGSKNKKTLMKEEQYKSGNMQKLMQLQQLHCVLSGKIKRGKGRPKGSKNKPKIPCSLVKKQTQDNLPFAGKRGKGRPKGSKNKIKVAEQIMMSQDNKQKRGRGRPPGAKNKPVSTPQISSVKQQSEQEPRFEFQRVQKDKIDELSCCRHCSEKKIQRDILQGLIYFQENIDEVEDVFDDIGLQNKTNLFLLVLQSGEIDRLKIFLQKRNKHRIPFKVPWKMEHVTEKTRFQVRTRKQFLSQTGKQGIYVLLHDSQIKKQQWWQQLGVERIIQNTPQYSQEMIKLILSIPELKQEMSKALPHVLRSGNTLMAEIMLKDMLMIPCENKFNYSQQHEDLLVGNLQKINNYKKFNLIKHNQGPNYCSPIHCAAVTANPEFLQKLLQLFTDVVNCEDSIQRKPIHYASASKNIVNLRSLVNHGAQLREFDKKKITPLMIACYYGVAENVEYILEKVREHSYINFRSDQGFSALQYAVLKSHEECVDLLLSDPYIKYDNEPRQTPDVFHIVAMTGNMSILNKLLAKWGSYLPNCVDKYKKNPAMYAIRNHNNDVLVKLLSQGCKFNKPDTSLNSLLHYAAAYGNLEAIILLRDYINQAKNKRNLYPWEFAIMKGHLGCAKLLEGHTFQFKFDPLEMILTNIRGTDEYLECVKYIAETMTSNIKYQSSSNGNSYLHMVCSLNQDEYVKQRGLETYQSEEQIREEFNKIMNNLVDYFKEKGLNGYIENKKKQSPLKLCIENVNLIGIQKLLTNKLTFDLQSAEGSTILHRLSNLACKGLEEMEFMEKKLRQTNINDLKINLKKIDQAGFDFLLYFVKNFTESIKKTFLKWVKKYSRKGKSEKEAEQLAFNQFKRFQSKFMSLVTYLTEMGCDVNGQVVDKKTDASESFRKWGIQHFLMRFPSLNLIKFFKNKIRDFNAENNHGMTPLHLFCKHIMEGNLLSAKHIKVPLQYETQNIIEYLLSNGLNPNTTDSTKSLPILYAAENNQYKFIMILLKNKSLINQVNSKNKVPFIEIIKNHRHYTLEQIDQILKKGAKPSFEDMDKKNSLHHLVACSTNFDSSSDVCKLLLDNNVKINSLDKYGRSPIFYCFDPEDQIQQRQNPNDKVELLQAMMKIPEINLNILDVYKRSILHYACRKNYFFSVTYLLDQNINIEILDHEENTPLAICLRYRNLDQAALIIKKGVKYGFVNDPLAQQKNRKMSYFAYAIKHLLVGICFMLIQTGYPIQKALQQVPNQAFKETLKTKYIK